MKNEVTPALSKEIHLNIGNYLHKPEYKKSFVEVLKKNPEWKDKLASTLFSEDMRTNTWEVFYKNFDNLTPGEISFLQVYLFFFQKRSLEEVGYGQNNFDKEGLRDEFERIKQANIRDYILKSIIKNPKFGGTESTYKIMTEIDKYIGSTNLDTNGDGHLDKDELQKIAQDIAHILAAVKGAPKYDELLGQLLNYNFDIAHNLVYTVDFGKKGQVVYESLDRHLPVTTDKDFSSKLATVTGPLTENMYWNADTYIDPDGKEKKLINQTQAKLKSMIVQFFNQHKHQLNSYGITDIAGISPQNAAKLAAMMSMHNLSYNHAQVISPKDEGRYIEGLNEKEKAAYLQDKNKAIDIALAIKEYLEEYKNLTMTQQLLSTALSEYRARRYILGVSNSQGDRDKMMQEYPNIVDDIYRQTSEFYITQQSNVDNLPVDQLLKGGKGVCRNYAMANAKIFDAIKALQPKDDNQLKNSSLPVILSNKNDNITPGRKEALEGNFANHAWNLLVSIDKDGLVHKTQIDSTWSDDKKGGSVYSLDRTYERFLQDMQASGLEPDALVSQLLKFSHHMHISNSGSPDMFKKIMAVIRELLDSNQIGVAKLAQLLGKDVANNVAIRSNISRSLINNGKLDDVKLLWNTDKLSIRVLLGVISKGVNMSKLLNESIDINGSTKEDFIKATTGYQVLLTVHNKAYLQKYMQVYGKIYDQQLMRNHG